MLFGSRQNCRGMSPASIRFRQDVVHERPTVRNLGVLFDKHLTWDAHVSSLVNKCYGILIGLSHLRHCIPKDLLPTIVNALVISHVRYCLAVFGNGSQTNMKRIQKIQNFALRVISGRRKFDHISDVRDELGWPLVPRLHKQHSLTLLHKIHTTGEPQALASQFRPNSELRSRNTRRDSDLALPPMPMHPTGAGERRFIERVVRDFNSLPVDTRSLSVPARTASIQVEMWPKPLARV